MTGCQCCRFEVCEAQNGVVALLQSKFRVGSTKGSRMVGGKKPRDTERYNKYEAVSYITPDTVKVEIGYRYPLKKVGKHLWTPIRLFDGKEVGTTGWNK